MICSDMDTRHFPLLQPRFDDDKRGKKRARNNQTTENELMRLSNVSRVFVHFSVVAAGSSRVGAGAFKFATRGSGVRLEENSGAGTTTQYICWKMWVNFTLQLHGVTDQDLAFLIVSQLKGTAKVAVDISKVEDFEGSQGLQIVWQILDQSHGQFAHERQRHGLSVHDWIVDLKRTRLEVEAQFENVGTSNKQVASKLLRDASLAPEKKSQVLFS